MHHLTAEEAIALFRQWGFRVEAGPREDEITLILEMPDARVYSVHPVSALPELGSVVLSVRWRAGSVSGSRAPEPRSAA